nr:unnamed protein product [Trichobilharzia regenti]
MLHGICFSCLYRPLKPKSKLESLDLSKETDETTVGLIEEIQSNLIASNAFIRSNLFFNSTNRMGQTLYEVEETNEDEQHQQQLRQQQRSSNKQPCKTNEMMKDHNAKISQSDEHQNENGNGNKDEKETVKQIDKKLIQSTDISQMPLSTILPDTKRKIEVSIAEDATDNDLKARQQKQQKQQQPESEGQFATLDRNRNLIDDQSVVHTTSKMPPKSVRPRKHDSSSYVFSTPCLSVNRPYDEETGGGTAKALQDIYKKKSRQYVRNQLLPNQRLQRPVASRQRHLSHNLTPNIPTIEEDQVLTKSCAHGQLHAPTTPKEFSSSITLANLYRDRRGMPLDPNSFSSGLIPGSVISGLATYPQKLEVYKVDSKPVLVALPHQSITVEDYSRPLYRSDIFFSGNPIPNISNEQQYSPAIGLSSSGIFHKTTNQQNLKDTDMCNSRLTVQWNDTPAAPITATTTTIASALSSGHHLIDQSQPNRMESFLVSLTSIPFPNDDDDNRRDGAATGGGGGEVASMLINKQRLDEKLHKSISEYDNRLQNLTPDDVDDEDEVYATSIAAVADDNVCLSECCLTGIRRLRDGRLCPSISSCLRRLYNCFTCFTHKQKRIYKPVNKEFTDGDYDGVDGDESNSLNDDGGYDDDDVDDELPKCTPNHSVPCKSFTFKPIIDVLSTMLDLSLLREPKYLLLWISNLIGVLGLYVPLIYVSDFASIYGISSQLSSYLLSIMGGSSIVSRLLFAWISGLPHVSPLVVQTIAQFLLGVLVCAMPILTTFTGMAVAFAFYGFFSGVFSTLSTIILYNLVGMDQLTTAVGLITLSRGLSSVFGPPLAGLLFEATQGFEIPYFVAGMFIIMSALLFLLIACYNRIARLLTNLILRYDKAKTSKLHLEQQDEDGQLKQKLNKGDDDTC